MPHVTFTRHLVRFFPTLTEGEVEGATVREVVAALDRRYPGLASYLVDETGRLRRHVNVFIGDEPVADRAALSDALAPTDRVFILQALSGG
ncbi:MAG: MoaD/ThiS family protein [Kofleriaceae bacterium]|jgi:molybdopterin synthase sulfur carrier subunit|nr:MoaD/ThiS family protein [Kofleriaceae bacterium]